MARRSRLLLNEPSQRDEIAHPERGAPGSHRHEHVRLRRIGPPHGHRVLGAAVVQEEDSVLTPRLADTGEDELVAAQRVERTR